MSLAGREPEQRVPVPAGMAYECTERGMHIGNDLSKIGCCRASLHRSTGAANSPNSQRLRVSEITTLCCRDARSDCGK